jgi:hypothetical protein
VTPLASANAKCLISYVAGGGPSGAGCGFAMRIRSLLPSLILLLPAIAVADYREGEVPEAGNASTLRAHEIRISLVGPSAIGLNDHTELSTFLLADAVLFPNLQLEHRFVDGEVSASWSVGIGGGALPVVGGTVLPLPGAIMGVGGVGILAASEQHAALHVSWRAAAPLTLSASVGAFALEGGFAGVVGGAGVGGGGGAVGAGIATGGSTRGGPTASLEAAATLGAHDAVVVSVDGYKFSPFVMDGPTGLLYGRASWTHAWEHFALSLGAYGFADPPHFNIPRNSKLPLGPFMSVAWSWR